ncbi:MAG: hypothetical protein U0X75_16845 [Acidobacteriota bacterium]
MTGDGVVITPALKRSDVGVAMGERGSDVAREVADLVLLDDNFATIVAAIEEGRNIYEIFRNSSAFCFSANLALVLLVIGGAAGAFWLNFARSEAAEVVDAAHRHAIYGSTSLPTGLLPSHWALIKTTDVMRPGPRHPQAPLLDRVSLRFVFTAGITQALVGGALLAILPQLGYSNPDVRGALFLYATR